MRKKLALILSIFFPLSLLFSVAHATYVIKNETTEGYVVDESGIPQEVSGSSIYLLLDPNDGLNPIEEYGYSGSLSSVPVPSNVVGNHTFVGYYSTRNGIDSYGYSTKLTDSNGSFLSGVSLSSGDRLYARYANVTVTENVTRESKISIGDNTNLASITEEVSAAWSDVMDETMICLSADFARTKNIYYLGTPDSDPAIYLLSGAYVHALYKGSSRSEKFTFADYGKDTTVKTLEEADLIIKLDCDLVIDGGTFSLNSLFGYGSGTFCNGISGGFTALDLNGYTMTIRNGGIFYAHGIVYNSQDSGGIVNEDGTIYANMTFIDFKGGGYFALGYTRCLNPFYQFCVPYLTCEVVLTSSSLIAGDTCISASGRKVSTANYFPMIGSSTSTPLISLESGYCVKRAKSYDKFLQEKMDEVNTFTKQDYLYDSDFRESVVFTNDLTGHLDYLDVSLPKVYHANTVFTPLSFSTTYSFKYVDFPIPSYYDLEFHGASIEIGFSILILPGANVYVDEESIVSLTSIAAGSSLSFNLFGRISVLDEFPSDFRFGYSYASSGVTTTSYVSHANDNYQPHDIFYGQLKSKVEMNGVFEFDTTDTTVDLTSVYDHYYSLGGKVDCSKQALESIAANSATLELCSRFYFGVFYSGPAGGYSTSPYQYYNDPLISNGNAYFQIGGVGNEVVMASSTDAELGIYEYGGRYYFYKYDTESYSYGDYDTALNMYSDGIAPTNTRYANKCRNLAGKFTAASSFLSLDKGGYLTYGSGTSKIRVPFAGVWIPVSSAPTNSNNTLTLVSNTSNKFYPSYVKSPDSSYAYTFLMSSTLNFDLKKNRWVIADAD